MLVPQELAQVVQAEQAALLEAQVPHSSKQPLVQLAAKLQMIHYQAAAVEDVLIFFFHSVSFPLKTFHTKTR